MTRLPISRVNTSQETLPAIIKDIYRRISIQEARYPGGPKVGSTVAVASAADLPTPYAGMTAHVLDTGTVWEVPGVVPLSSLPPAGVWADTGVPP